VDSRLSFHAGGLRAECLILWECSQRAACSSGRDRFQLRVLGGYSLSAQLADSVLLMVFQGEYLLTHWSHSFGAAVMADGVDFGYVDCIFHSDLSSTCEKMNGGLPWCDSLASWAKESPPMRLNKVHTPLAPPVDQCCAWRMGDLFGLAMEE